MWSWCGCVETARPTTHHDPVYVVNGVIHYCVANMPGAVPRTSTLALTNATFPYLKELADHGWEEACRRDGLGDDLVAQHGGTRNAVQGGFQRLQRGLSG